ncbi:unnamed protein product [marine sediment metagenome]|uniref:Uncharacterized protein n=1 Tax=marine sediment metagenome TaxID=412755 RepID=X0TA59_9ZZZZ
MALVVGTNSWATLVEADLYLTDRIHAEVWFTLLDTPANPGEESKESYLISAFYWLSGSPQLEIPASSTAANVKIAQIEGAFFLQEHYEALNERRAAIATGLDSFRYSKRMENLSASDLKIPDYILGMLGEFGTMNTTAILLGEYDL